MLISVHVSQFYFSEDEGEEGLSYLPIAPEVDEPEEIGLGQLEVRF